MAEYAYDDWVGQVRPDPRNTDQLTLLQGYLGQSSESGHIRVYSDESLNDFVEVPEDAIVYAQQLSQAESSLGGSKLWLRSDVVITYGDPKSANRPKTTFLEGDLMQQYTTQYGGAYDPTGGMGAYGGQPAGQGGQFMASAACPMTTIQVQCQIQPALTVPAVICKVNWNTIIKTKCGFSTCFKTLCGPVTCIKVLCDPIPGCGFNSAFPTPGCGGVTFNPISLACNPGGPGPVIQPGGFMGQPDTTQYAGGFDTTGGMGGQFMATVAQIQCQAQPFTIQVANCPILQTFAATRCAIRTCLRTIPGVDCPPFQTCQFGTRIPGCFGGTRFPGCFGGSVILPTDRITDVINPGTIGGFGGQPDTTTMGGYYGQFNPYTTMY